MFRVAVTSPKGQSNEVECAIDLGADEVLVPMVRHESEVERVLASVRDRIGVGIMVETPEAVARASSLAGLGICRAFVGLLDLALERATPSVLSQGPPPPRTVTIASLPST